MSLSIGLTFPAGRFHATPWGHHVNEGLPEWPPSPWRFLRALVATWKRKLPSDTLVERELPSALAELAKSPPQFHLPPATLGHTRHYMPLRYPDRGDKTKVFDAFVSMDSEADVVLHWPEASLSPDGSKALGLVLFHLGYFGRAESWAVARLLSDFDAACVNCFPGPTAQGHEPVRVLVPDPTGWNEWAYDDKKIPKPDPLWNLLAETADMQREGWSDPPGSRWQTYARRSDCFAPRATRQRPSPLLSNQYTVARYALDGPVLPLVEETLTVAERVRVMLMGIYKRLKLRQLYGSQIPVDAPHVASEVFAGKDAAGLPLTGHQHAFFLPSDEDQDGRLDHVTIVASRGFDRLEVRALDLFRNLRFREDRLQPLRLLLIGLGRRKDFQTPLFGPSEVWISATPFIVTRMPKHRGRKKDPPHLRGQINEKAFAEQVLREQIAVREMAEPVDIASLPENRMGAHALRPIQFKRFRQKRGDDGGRRPAGGFRITFGAPVQGPLCLGHSCHFGLGLFVPAESRKAP